MPTTVPNQGDSQFQEVSKLLEQLDQNRRRAEKTSGLSRKNPTRSHRLYISNRTESLEIYTPNAKLKSNI
jgi:hypothetical protein